MPVIKNEFPILEYDAAKSSIIEDAETETLALPERAVFAFLRDEVTAFAEAHQARIITEFDSATKLYPIYECDYHGEKVCLCQAPVGAAPAVQLLDYLIQNGVRKIISTGSCGTLVDIPENEWLIPAVALRDEGISYHYLPPAREIKTNQAANQAIAATLTTQQLKFAETKTWTTDGFFRETPDMINYRVSEGCHVVEMECAGLAACAQFRGAIWGELLYTADTLADTSNYQQRNFGGDSIAIALKLALAAVILL
ncbi:nucleoside phosphorylase [Lapidilactobacillus wuchangensis]|uniref:nucleoside phosphorylase n=1 Tax=Lapidilactobacillus wuchangensis TaxID=2486001 RepID=UPI000F78785A|nr:nucleoside phosphorylase [Lapidilactobacillus wuchangensis]